ncbi:hypothetical protein [Streptomyces sp. 8N706]|uniref:hypothetical protein n=1 Tax=Streptomyces sp. 8N706 TaxID=3457416 RepID=UPI003FCEEE32
MGDSDPLVGQSADMVDGNALYGLVGAVAGALVTGVAGIFGPLKLQKRNAEQQYATDRRTSDDVEVQRLIDLRTTVRAWHTALQDIAQELELGRSVDFERFEQVVHGRREAASAAIDAGIRSDVYVHQINAFSGPTGDVPPLRVERVQPAPPRLPTATPDQGVAPGRPSTERRRPRSYFDHETRERFVLVLDVLEAATRLIRGLVIKGSQLQEDDRTDLDSALSEVSRARDRLATLLLDRIAEIRGRPIRMA